MPQEESNTQQQPVVQQEQQPVQDLPTSGYIPSQADLMRDYKASEQQATQEQRIEDTPMGADLQELAEKLGVNPEDIGQPPAPEPPEEKVYADPDDWYSEQFSTPEASKFADDFRKYVGFDIKEVYGLIKQTAEVTKGVDQWRQEAYAQQQLNSLRQDFGEEFDSLMPQVLDRFAQIREVNPQQAAALDNPDGARMLAALIRQEQSQGVQQPPSQKNVPNFLPNKRQVTHGRNQPPVIKYSEMMKWSGEEIDRRYGEILQAKQNGTLIYDI